MVFQVINILRTQNPYRWRPMKTTIALILAGGRVDELSVLTLYRPKSALPFGGL